MHAIACGVLLLVVTQEAERRRAADEGWAREVVTHFLDSALSLNEQEALALATKRFRKRLGRSYPNDESRGLRDIVFDVVWAARQAGKPAHPVARRVVVSPAGDEARITGELRVGEGGTEPAVAHFIAMLSRSAGGRWRVDGLTANLLTPAVGTAEPAAYHFLTIQRRSNCCSRP